jgi:hypothetical protein
MDQRNDTAEVVYPIVFSRLIIARAFIGQIDVYGRPSMYSPEYGKLNLIPQNALKIDKLYVEQLGNPLP